MLQPGTAHQLCKGKNLQQTKKQTKKQTNLVNIQPPWPHSTVVNRITHRYRYVWCSLGLSAVSAYLRVWRSRVHVQVGIGQRFSVRVATTGAYIHGPSGDIFWKDLACWGQQRLWRAWGERCRHQWLVQVVKLAIISCTLSWVAEVCFLFSWRSLDRGPGDRSFAAHNRSFTGYTWKDITGHFTRWRYPYHYLFVPLLKHRSSVVHSPSVDCAAAFHISWSSLQDDLLMTPLCDRTLIGAHCGVCAESKGSLNKQTDTFIMTIYFM